MNSKYTFPLFIGIIAIAALVWAFLAPSGNESPLHATSFEECVSLGNPVMESYPRQCNDAAGNHFVEEVEGLNAPSYVNASSDDIVLENVNAGDRVTSPLTLTGIARGYWFFEASFPVVLTDWDGLIIAEGYATAGSEWMTTDFVPFEATLSFTKPSYGERGTLILKRDNPSGLPENDAALEIPIRFE